MNTAALHALPTQDARCFHCGEVARFASDTRRGRLAVCCSGCAAAIDFVEESGLGAFYEERAPLFARGRRPTGGVDPRFTSAPAGASIAAAGLNIGSDSALERSTYDEKVLRTVAQIDDKGAHLPLFISNLTCSACVWLLESVTRAQGGKLSLDLSSRVGRLSFAGDTRFNEVLSLFQSLGYQVTLIDGNETAIAAQGALTEDLKRLGVAGIGAMQVMMLAFARYFDAEGSIDAQQRFLLVGLEALITAVVLAIAGRPWWMAARNAWLTRRWHLDLTISLGLAAGFSLSLLSWWRGTEAVYFDAVCTLVFLVSLARHISARWAALLRTGSHLPLLVRLQEGQWVKASQIRGGEHVMVEAGAVVPFDGWVSDSESASATSWVDESLLTGEAEPVAKKIGDPLLAGSRTLAAGLRLRVAAPQASSRWRQMEMVADQRRAQCSSSGEPQSARWLSFAVVGSALLAGMGLTSDAPATAALAVLIVACPCAFVMAAPLAQAASILALRRVGVETLDANGLGRLAAVNHAVFDKTGTLTTPRRLFIDTNSDEPYCKAVVLTLEANSNHPLAQAVRLEWADSQNPLPTATQCREDECGVEGRIESAIWRFQANPWARNEHELLCNGEQIARIRFDEVLRPNAALLFRRLGWQGITSEICSGDEAGRVQRAADELAVPARSRQLPDSKAARLDQLRTQGFATMMVGDGANDAIALAAADVGVAMSSGANNDSVTCIARTNAHFWITNTDLAAIPTLIELGRRYARRVRLGRGLSLAYNLAVIPLAMFGLMTPLFAAVGMGLSSLMAVSVAFSLRRDISL